MNTDEEKPAATIPAPSEQPPVSPPHSARRKPWLVPLVGLAVILVLIKGALWVWHSMHTVSTDDAYVNSHVTFVAPRVAGQVARVLVDDNNRVKKGDVLVELDPEPYRVQVAIKQAVVDAAQADLVMAEAVVRSQVGQLRSLRFKLDHAIEDVGNQIALLRARGHARSVQGDARARAGGI